MALFAYDYYEKRYTGNDPNADLPVSIEDWMEAAKQKMSPEAWSYISSSAGSASTEMENRKALERYRLRPRYMINVKKDDMSTTFLGKRHKFPVALAPIGVTSIIHDDAEAGIARAARNIGIPFSVSTVSSITMEDAAAAAPDAERYFQLYPPKDTDVMRSFIKRAEKAGYSALIVTADTTVIGWRESDLKLSYIPFFRGIGLANYMSDDVFVSKLKKSPSEDMVGAVMAAISIFMDQSLNWERFREIVKMTKLPVVLKGVTHPDDVNRAFELGAKAVVISNHGGRQVDGAISSIDALYEIWKNGGAKGELLFDSGIRHGADIVKALTMGASAVLIGRPFCYAYAAGGQRGIEVYMKQLLSELNVQMALSGNRTVDDLKKGEIYRI